MDVFVLTLPVAAFVKTVIRHEPNFDTSILVLSVQRCESSQLRCELVDTLKKTWQLTPFLHIIAAISQRLFICINAGPSDSTTSSRFSSLHQLSSLSI